MPVIIRSRLRRTTVRGEKLVAVAEKILVIMRKSRSELGLEIVGKDRIRRLNRIFRGQDYPTDVLAFPLQTGPLPFLALLGDVVISLPVAVTQAKRFGQSIDEELVRLLIHGILHLFGYDHEQGPQEAKRMRRKEHMIFQALTPIPKLVKNP